MKAAEVSARATKMRSRYVMDIARSLPIRSVGVTTQGRAPAPVMCSRSAKSGSQIRTTTRTLPTIVFDRRPRSSCSARRVGGPDRIARGRRNDNARLRL